MDQPGGFGALFKELRLGIGATLRQFCETNGFDAGNMSKLERGTLKPPTSSEKLEQYANALGLKPGTEQWVNFFDRAAAERGRLPQDVAAEADLVAKLPLVFRTLRGQKLTREQLEHIAKIVQEA